MISGVVTENATAFPAQNLMMSYFDLIGSSATEKNLALLEEGIVNHYLKNGYFAPQVFVESHPQFGNIFSVKISEPILLSFRVNGGRSDTRTKANSYLNTLIGSNLVSSSAINYLVSSLENRLGVGVDLSYTELTQPARGFDIAVQLTGDISSSLTLSNSGNNSLGRETVFAEIQFVEQLPGFNSIYLNTFDSLDGNGYRSLGAGFNYELNSNNEVNLNTNRSRVRYKYDSRIKDTIYDQTFISLKWQVNVAESANTAKYFYANYINQQLERRNLTTDLEETLNIVELAYWQQNLSNNSSNYWKLGFGKGLDSMGSELVGVVADSDIELDFSRYTMELIYNLDITENSSLTIDFSAQYSNDYLPYSQRFVAASNSVAPAYEFGEWSGDSGAGFKVELARGVNLSLLSSRWVPYLYYGAGKVRDNYRKESTSVGSVGLGARWFNKKMSFYCELGKPLTEDSVYRGSHARVDTGLTLWF